MVESPSVAVKPKEVKLKAVGKYPCVAECSHAAFMNPQALKMHQKICNACIRKSLFQPQPRAQEAESVVSSGGEKNLIEDVDFGESEARGVRLVAEPSQSQLQARESRGFVAASPQPQPQPQLQPLGRVRGIDFGGNSVLLVFGVLFVVALIAGGLFLVAAGERDSVKADLVSVQTSLVSKESALSDASSRAALLENASSSCVVEKARVAAELSSSETRLTDLAGKELKLAECLTNSSGLSGVIALKDLNLTNYLEIERLKRQLVEANYSLQLAYLNLTMGNASYYQSLFYDKNASYSNLSFNFARWYCPVALNFTCNSTAAAWFNVSENNVTCFKNSTVNVTGNFTC